MLPGTDSSSENHSAADRKSPWTCKLLLAIALTYFLVITLLFLTALVFCRDLVRSIGNYIDAEAFNINNITGFVLLGAILFGIASAGLIVQMSRRQWGFYMFFAAGISLLVLDLVFMNFDWLRYMLQTGFIFLAGAVHFSKRCYQ